MKWTGILHEAVIKHFEIRFLKQFPCLRGRGVEIEVNQFVRRTKAVTRVLSRILANPRRQWIVHRTLPSIHLVSRDHLSSHLSLTRRDTPSHATHHVGI